MGTQRGRRRLPVGAEPLPEGGVHFRVWAPRAKRVQLILERSRTRPGGSNLAAVELDPEGKGYFSGWVRDSATGDLYSYRLDEDDTRLPDPVSRFQPEGPHGPSQVVDPSSYRWEDRTWKGAGIRGQVIYEMHIGTFTTEGNWSAACREIADLAADGITVLELMPVAEFPGTFGWGYDGVDMFAPYHHYGTPDDFRSFVDRAHALGLAVILDVVYNHLGPDGNYLKQFSQDYFTDRYENEWGEAINYDGKNSGPVREFAIANAGYWIDEYHLDGLRLDATQAIYDASPEHIISAIARRVREVAGGRETIIVAENEPQQTKLIKKRNESGYELDALWNDDFHHSAMVAATGHNEAYYMDYQGSPQELISAVKWGFLFQGQRYRWQQKRRGTPSLFFAPEQFILFTQNHDQIANSTAGLRCHQLTSPGRYRAITALTLLAPNTPMLFQGQEFGASTPFLYFADHRPEVAKMVREGRADFLSQFPSISDPSIIRQLADPADERSFTRSKLDLSERQRNSAAYSLHRDLLRLRREDRVLSAQRPGSVDGAVLGSEAFVLRFFGNEGDDRLLLVNLGRDLWLESAPEPLLAPPEGQRWELLWSSESPLYGGLGVAPIETDEGWRLPGQAAAVLLPRSIDG